MKYLSTRGRADRKRFCEILLEGLAPDGGLYLPEHYPVVDAAQLTRWRQVLRDQGYAGARVQTVLKDLGCIGVIPPQRAKAPGHVGERWVVERTHSWLNAFGKLRRCTERGAVVVDLFLFLAASIVVIQQLLRAAFLEFRWATRSTTRRLR